MVSFAHFDFSEQTQDNQLRTAAYEVLREVIATLMSLYRSSFLRLRFGASQLPTPVFLHKSVFAFVAKPSSVVSRCERYSLLLERH